MDMLAKFPAITLNTAVETFAPLFTLAHYWNEGDTYPQVSENKRKFVQDTLLDAVYSGQLKGDIIRKPVRELDGFPALIGGTDQVETELDVQETWFDMDGATSLLLGLLKGKKCKALDMLQGEPGCQPLEEDVVDQEIIANVEAMPLPILKKKVKELTNEKVKWDRSIEVATKIGLLFYEKGVQKPASEAAFVSAYKKDFEWLPKKTVSMIYKALPVVYRNLGNRPSNESCDIAPVIDAAVFAGYMEGTQGDVTGRELIACLRTEGYDLPDEQVMQKIQEAMLKLK